MKTVSQIIKSDHLAVNQENNESTGFAMAIVARSKLTRIVQQAEERAVNRSKDAIAEREMAVLTLLRSERDNREAAIRSDVERCMSGVEERFLARARDLVAEQCDGIAETCRREMKKEQSEAKKAAADEAQLAEERAVNRVLEVLSERELSVLKLLRSEAENQHAATRATFLKALGEAGAKNEVQTNARILSVRAAPQRLKWPALADAAEARPIDETVSMEEALRRLEQVHPRAFDFWEERLPANDHAYRTDPAHNCSVLDNQVVSAFRDFISPYLDGPVLDVGCGTLGVPGYLTDYPVDMISGIDPLSPHEPHPFQFVQGVAEVLPWPDNSFSAVVIATSLDHVMSVDMALSEAKRVLKPNGVLLLWIGMVAGAVPYDPDDPQMQPIDDYHLFHFDRDWFEQKIGTCFTLYEHFDFNSESHFYALTALPISGTI